MRLPSSCLYLFGFALVVSGATAAPTGFPDDQHPRDLGDKDDLSARGYNAGLVGQTHAGGAAGARAQGRINKGHARRDLDDKDDLLVREFGPGLVGKTAGAAGGALRQGPYNKNHNHRDLDKGIEASPLSDRDQVQSRAVHVSNEQFAGPRKGTGCNISRRDLDEGDEDWPLSDRDQVQDRAVHVSNVNLSPTDPRTHTAGARKTSGCSSGHTRRDLDEGVEASPLSDRDQTFPVQPGRVLFPNLPKKPPPRRRSLSSLGHDRRDLDEGIEASPLSDREIYKPNHPLFGNFQLYPAGPIHRNGRRDLSSLEHARRDLDERVEEPLSDRDLVQPRAVHVTNAFLKPTDRRQHVAGIRNHNRRDLDEKVEEPLSDRDQVQPRAVHVSNVYLKPSDPRPHVAGPRKHNRRDLDEGVEEPLSDRDQVQPRRVLFPNLEQLRSSASKAPPRRRDLDEGFGASPLSDRGQVLPMQPGRVLFPNLEQLRSSARNARRDLEEGVEGPLSDRGLVQPGRVLFPNLGALRSAGKKPPPRRRDLDEGIEASPLSDRDQVQPRQPGRVLFPNFHLWPAGPKTHSRRDLDEGVEEPLSDRDQVQPRRVLFPNLEQLRTSARNARRDLDEGVEEPLSDRDQGVHLQPGRVLFPNFHLWPAGPKKPHRRDLDEGVEEPLSDRDQAMPMQPGRVLFPNFQLWPAGPRKHPLT